MKESGYYPAGAEFDPNAPYNIKDNKPKKTKVVVSITLSKPFTIECIDYKRFDPTEFYYNLEEEAKEQIMFPQEVVKYIKNKFKLDKTTLKELEDADGWDVDEYCVNLDE